MGSTKRVPEDGRAVGSGAGARKFQGRDERDLAWDDPNTSRKRSPSQRGKHSLPERMEKPGARLAWKRWGGRCRGCGGAGQRCQPSVEGGQETLGFDTARGAEGSFSHIPAGDVLGLLPVEEPRTRQEGMQSRRRSRSPQHLPVPQTFSQPRPPGQDVQPVRLQADGGESRLEISRVRG